MIDGYVSGSAGDGNHDDFIQGFAQKGAVFENILIEENFLLDRSSNTRALLSDYQGIAIFDCLFRNVTIGRSRWSFGAEQHCYWKHFKRPVD